MKWDQVHFSDGKLYVSRLKNGDPSVNFLEGDEIRMLRKLQRDLSRLPVLVCYLCRLRVFEYF